jgi:hypothetical protein
MPSGSCQTGDQTGADRVTCGRKNDWDHIGCLLQCHDGRRSGRHNNVDLELDEFGGDFGETFAASFHPAILNCDRAPFNPAQLAHAEYEGVDPFGSGGACIWDKEPDSWQLVWLLRAHRQRPRNCRAAEQRDELAAFHSITSLARERRSRRTSPRS